MDRLAFFCVLYAVVGLRLRDLAAHVFIHANGAYIRGQNVVMRSLFSVAGARQVAYVALVDFFVLYERAGPLRSMLLHIYGVFVSLDHVRGCGRALNLVYDAGQREYIFALGLNY